MRKFGILAVALVIIGLILALGGFYLLFSTDPLIIEDVLFFACIVAMGLGALLVPIGVLSGVLILVLSFAERRQRKYGDEPSN